VERASEVTGNSVQLSDNSIKSRDPALFPSAFGSV
jgi:hypothetical protein